MTFPAKVSPQPRTKPLVLCIDDDQRGLHARKAVLKAAGYDVITAASGMLGLRLLSRHDVHLVILDYRMPKMDGGVVAREIRRRHPHLPIIMLSGQIEVPDSVSRSVDVFVAKEQSPTVLLDSLNVLVGGAEKRLPGTPLDEMTG
jgi:CheY-like chemotaxis protein